MAPVMPPKGPPSAIRCGGRSIGGPLSEEGGSPDDRSRQEFGLVEREPEWDEWIVGPLRLAGRSTVRLVGTPGSVGLIVARWQPRRCVGGRRQLPQRCRKQPLLVRLGRAG